MSRKSTIRNSRSPGRRHVLALCMALGLIGTSVSAEPWEMGASVDVGVVYFDNIFLESSDPEAELIYLLVPEFAATKAGDRFNASVRYRAEGYHYQDLDDADDVSHLLDLTTSTAIARDRLFFDLFASAGQALVASDQAIVLTNVPIAGNRADYLTVTAQPRYQHEFSAVEVQAQSGYTYFDLQTDGEEPDFQVQSLFRLGNEFLERGLTWEVRYEHARIEFDNQLPYEYQRAEGTLGYWVGRTLRVFAGGGKESPIDDVLNPALESDIWEAGFQWAPNTAMSLEVAGGERNFGDTYRAAFRLGGPRGEMRATYSEGPEIRATILGGVSAVGINSLEGLLDPLGTSDRFLQKRGEFTLVRRFAKSEIQLQLLTDRRSNVVSVAGDLRSDERFDSVTVEHTWDISQRFQLITGADYLDFEDRNSDGEIKRGRVSLQFRFGVRTGVVFGIDHTAVDEVGLGGVPYDATQVSLLLRREFMF